MHATKHNLNNLIVFIDYNNMQAYGNLETVLPLGNLIEKFKSFGFDVKEINGHSRDEIIKSSQATNGSTKPIAVIAHTVKGKGIVAAENSSEWHHKAKISVGDVDDLLAGI